VDYELSQTLFCLLESIVDIGNLMKDKNAYNFFITETDFLKI